MKNKFNYLCKYYANSAKIQNTCPQKKNDKQRENNNVTLAGISAFHLRGQELESRCHRSLAAVERFLMELLVSPKGNSIYVYASEDIQKGDCQLGKQRWATLDWQSGGGCTTEKGMRG